ncbi:MAG: hypothetical protein SGILL_000803 [Bacillariaceae sp.]
MSLAEDAVLERLNSVLEPSRLLVLAEKGDNGSVDATKDDRVIYAHDDFRIFATMNPGGDYGKRELSPALRSRFTEIWVPSISSREDFDVVLTRSVSASLPIDQPSSVTGPMLDYLEWFNSTICGNPSSPFSGYDLSMRDVLSWSHFLVASQASISVVGMWDAFYHGACLMHLDGLGLGSGLSQEASRSLKMEARSRLLSIIPDSRVTNLEGVDEEFCLQNGMFGASPYYVEVGSSMIPESNFDMSAPTTSLNVFRVLRAMQLKKPILLEGPPGVGKTSLISALAAASGHKLVRINLSEQTDMGDLMGNDLPVESSTTSGPAFEWHDGVLLTAIKEGSWVLLDELNLAPQAVLEGLNSCLDHRGTVFIPEIGKTFDCPPSFRVFGAQNPLGQGGGRKGLPKSFLNRFTKVFVDSLTDSDFESIMTSKFKSLSLDFVKKVINFNNQIHREVVDTRDYGLEGGPWEFNLRDIFRWAELLEKGGSSEGEAARDLYYQRFRTPHDRSRVDGTFQAHFGTSMASHSPPVLTVSNSTIQIGNTVLQRHDPTNNVTCAANTRKSGVLFSNLLPMEAVARCISLRWPCLLVGGTGSGKSSIVSSLSQLCNATLLEQCLSPSSDVSELLGAFEQVESNSKELQALKDLRNLGHNILLSDCLVSCGSSDCWLHLAQLDKLLSQSSYHERSLSSTTTIDSKNHPAERLLEVFDQMVREDSRLCGFKEELNRIRAEISHCAEIDKGSESEDTGHFAWRDGILVEAMVKGYWLVLENVNLCPASVLDRLNSVTERDGSLLLSESGTLEGEENTKSHRLITPHENFRIFLTMDPSNGEISRAMRNRCVEISLLQSRPSKLNFPKIETADMLSQLRNSGIRTLEVAKGMVQMYLDEATEASDNLQDVPFSQCILDSGKILSSLLIRGIGFADSIEKLGQLSYEREEAPQTKALVDVPATNLSALPENLLPSHVLSPGASWERRLLRSFSSTDIDARKTLDLFGGQLGLLGVSDEDPQIYQILDTLNAVPVSEKVELSVTNLFLDPPIMENLEMKVRCLSGLKCRAAAAIQLMVASWLKQLSRGCKSLSPCLQKLMWERTGKIFEEAQWTHNCLQKGDLVDSTADLTVMEASLYVHKNVLDGSLVTCAVTRLIFPFFAALDQHIRDSIARNQHVKCETLGIFLGGRDTLWNLAKDLPLNLNLSGPVAFDDGEFITQWRWLRKRMSGALFDHSMEGYQKVILLAEVIDQRIFGGSLVHWGSHKIRKKMVIPLTPSQSIQWKDFVELNGLAKKISLMEHRCLDPFQGYGQSLTLQELMEESHPFLYVTDQEKFELLAALSTLQLSWPKVSNSKSVWIDGIDFAEKLGVAFETQKNQFELEIATARIDKKIQTVENQIEATSLDALACQSQETLTKLDAFGRLKDKLFGAMERHQLSTLAEFWCAWKETEICAELCRILLECRDGSSIQRKIASLSVDLKALVQTVVSTTTWNVGDMRSFQLLIWMAEQNSKDGIDLKALLRSLIPTMLSALSRHSFSSSLLPLRTTMDSFEMPEMFGDDAAQKQGMFYSMSNADQPDVILGTTRLLQHVRSEFMLNSFGRQLSLSNQHSPSKLYTIENAKHREQQSKKAMNLVSSFQVSVSKSRLFTYHYVLLDILNAVQDVFSDNEMQPILEMVQYPDRLSDLSSVDDIDLVGNKVQNAFFHKYWRDLLLPLLKSMHKAWRSNLSSISYAEQFSHASIYLGLLRLCLSVPESPLDPGKAPLAKVSLIDRQLQDVKSKVVAKMLHKGFVEGDFSPVTNEVTSVLHHAESLTKKRDSQTKKIVERMEEAAPFYELFSEVKDFTTTVGDPRAVLDIVNSAQDKRSSDALSLRERIKNWQLTAAAFCKRMPEEFAGYDDVLTPLLDSVRMIQDGFFHFLLPYSEESPSATIRDHMLQYPLSVATDSIETLRKAMQQLSGSHESNESSLDCLSHLSLAILTRYFLKASTSRLSNKEIMTCSALFTDFSSSSPDVSTELTKEASVEEIEENAFREQFPDHRKDFESVLLATQEDDDLLVPDDNSNHSEKIQKTDIVLTEDLRNLLYQIYVHIFGGGSSIHTDFARKICFHCSYSSAYEIQQCFKTSQNCGGQEHLGGHAFAVALSLPPTTMMSKMYPYFSDTSKVTDFQNEACPSVALAAAAPLEHLMARTTQLLNAFPGHSILLGLFKVCERVSKLNLVTTPIGKVMTGVEIILRQAQDWEQHASQKVQLGAPLDTIGKLISEWRRLELESWGNLLHAREKRYTNKARNHWIRLHGLLSSNQPSASPKAQLQVAFETWEGSLTPIWVWKGLKHSLKGFIDTMSDVHLNDIRELVKAFDTFILTSPLGEFKERLNILKTCSSELMTGYRIQDRKSTWKLQQARATFSVWKYYDQYSPYLIQRIEGFRKPVAEKLKNETKLAKWDMQSYYALAESTERNQRKLMKILSEFDESLHLNVGILIQEYSCHGLRDSIDNYDECCATFPSTASMFPHEGKLGEDTQRVMKQHALDLLGAGDLARVDQDRIGVPLDARLRKVGKYLQRMATTRTKLHKSESSRARIGGDQASFFCEAIFDRIEALRTKSTRPMKERALVDLFRELKQHGFSTAKWATPSELKDMEHLFLLPTPKVLVRDVLPDTSKRLEKAEEYFMKCISEIHGLTSETRMLGSKYMTKREIELMINLGYSGMTMLTQQRSLISKASSETEQLQAIADLVPLSKSNLPLRQAALCRQVEEFEEGFAVAVESIGQLRLLFQTVSSSIDNATESDWARDVAVELESIVQDCDHTRNEMFFVTQEKLSETNESCHRLKSAGEMITKFQRQRLKTSSRIPDDPFEICSANVRFALEAGNKCKVLTDAQHPERKEEHSTYNAFCERMTATIESALVCYQNLSKCVLVDSQKPGDVVSTADQEDQAEWIGECHKEACLSTGCINVRKVSENFVDTLKILRDLHDNETASSGGLECCLGLIANSKSLLAYTVELSRKNLDDAVHFYASLAKLNYVLLRVFRVLVSKGYCSDKTSEGDEEGDVNGMTFEDDNDGTGMGEGDGKNDVTDQLDNEDQLAGLKSDEKQDEAGESTEPKQLNEEEADQGMEMEADFEGDMFDMPENQQDEKEMDDNENEEELDREMGDDANADDQVVDEKMWDDSDDEEDVDAGQEKFEQDSGVQGDPIDDAIRTKEDNDEDDGKASAEKNDAGNENLDQGTENEDEEGERADQDEEKDINDDLEDRYEESHGVDVRGEEDENGQEDPTEDQMELENDLDLSDKMDEDDVDEANCDNDADDNDSTNEGDGQDAGAEQAEGAADDEDEEDTEHNNEKTQANAAEGDMDIEKGEEEPEHDDDTEQPIDVSRQDQSNEAAHGVRSKDGADAVAENSDTEEQEEAQDDGDDFVGNPTGGKSQGDQTEADGNDDGGYSNQTNETSDQSKSENDTNDFPNPMKDPGDASKFWHRRLNVIENTEEEREEDISQETAQDDREMTQEPEASNYQYSSGQADSTQVLGDATEEEAVELEPTKEEQNTEEDAQKENEPNQEKDDKQSDTKKHEDKMLERKSNKRETKKAPKEPSESNQADENDQYESGTEEVDGTVDPDDDASTRNGDEDDADDNDEVMESGTKIVSDLSRLNVDEGESHSGTNTQIQQDEEIARVNIEKANEARSQWLVIQGETQGLSRRLCEKVRLVLEPLVASKLRGDYRTGKRINMKRVIGYIASGYRKDKIWLRRTKPAKRDYRVLLAVDDSESMKKSGAGEMALRAMATVAVGMNQLEVGELGVASFGDDMKLVHPFHMPFTSESGVEAVRNFQFDQQRTRIALCVESAMAALEEAGGGSSMQLVFLISDGRIERDSRSALKRLIREMLERNILLAMIIVEGTEKKKDSILNMKEVTFEKGKPIVKRFIEDYPFPYYIVLDDLTTLPEVLGDALKQWFEILTQLQSSGK